MRKLFNIGFYKKNYFAILILLIIALAFFLRFYNYPNRWSLAGDSARDVIIAKYAFENHKIPLTGPFSSAGNFTTGNVWYIWLIASYALFPFCFLTPWIAMTFVYVLIVWFMILLGKEIINRKFALLLGLLTAISPAQIAQSVNLTNPTLVAVFSILSIYFSIKYIKSGKALFLFLFPLFISLAINAHFQAIYMLAIIPIVLIFKRPNIKGTLVAILGITLPFIPYFVFDLKHNFYNLRGIIDYLQYGQYKIYIPNRWLTYAGIFFPTLWGKIIGGTQIFGYILIGAVILTTLYSFIKKNLNKQIVVILLSLAAISATLRYYRGERFDGYFVFLHPFVLILSAFAIYSVLKFNKIIGVLLIFAVSLFSINAVFQELTKGPGYINLQAEYWDKIISEYFPGRKIDFYAYNITSESISLPLSLFLYKNNRAQYGGYRVGMGSGNEEHRLLFKILSNNKMGYEFWDLNSSTSAELRKMGWHSVAPSEVYKTSAEWYKK